LKEKDVALYLEKVKTLDANTIVVLMNSVVTL